jgi:cytochrome P450
VGLAAQARPRALDRASGVRALLGDHQARRSDRALEAAAALPEPAAPRGIQQERPAAARGIAPEDPEFQREGSAQATIEGARIELFEYFDAMSRARRARPQDDIVSVVANARVDGKELDPLELLSYYFLLVVAGNETTRNAMTGGVLAFLENPGEWQRLKTNASLLDPAVEEVVRWVTPVIQFCRTATRDYELRDKTIRAGESA